MHNRSSYDEPYYYITDQHLRNTAHRRAVEQARQGHPARSPSLMAGVRGATARALIGLGRRIEQGSIALPELSLQHKPASD